MTTTTTPTGAQEARQGAAHTPEPWIREHEHVAVACHMQGHAYMPTIQGLPEGGGSDTVALRNANLDRAVACVNACAGINPDAVPELMAALRGLIDAYAALSEMHGAPFHTTEGSKYSTARAAIAKAEGKS